MDTSWPHTREVSLGPRAEQDRQEPSNWSLVNVRLQFTTQCLPCPRHCGLSGRGSFTFVQRDVAPLLYLQNLSSVTRGKHSMAPPSLDSLRAELRRDPPLQRQGKKRDFSVISGLLWNLFSNASGRCLYPD